MRTDSRSKKVFKYSVRIFSIIFLLFTCYLCLLYNNPGVFTVRPAYTTAILILAIISSVANIFISFRRHTSIYSVILLAIVIGCLGAFQQTNISLAYVIPIFLIYYFQNKRVIYRFLQFDIAIFFISRVLKSYLIYISSGKVYNVVPLIAGQMVVALLEAALFIGTVVPIFDLLLSKNEALNKALKEKESATDDILAFCSTATSYHNKYLTMHIKGVKEITQILLDSLIHDFNVSISEDYYKQVLFSVQFHDIGKIYIDSSILDKNTKLTNDELNLIRKHPEKGIELLSLLPKNVLDEEYLEVCRNVVAQHHEKLNGSGYPNGLKADEIPFEARIVAVADVADALLSWRPYKAPMSWDKMKQIFENDINCYDKTIVQALVSNKDKILEVSNKNNELLKNFLLLSEEDILRV